eukprot:72133-Pyramimonas_sp.AAC.2
MVRTSLELPAGVKLTNRHMERFVARQLRPFLRKVLGLLRWPVPDAFDSMNLRLMQFTLGSALKVRIKQAVERLGLSIPYSIPSWLLVTGAHQAGGGAAGPLDAPRAAKREPREGGARHREAHCALAGR